MDFQRLTTLQKLQRGDFALSQCCQTSGFTCSAQSLPRNLYGGQVGWNRHGSPIVGLLQLTSLTPHQRYGRWDGRGKGQIGDASWQEREALWRCFSPFKTQRAAHHMHKLQEPKLTSDFMKRAGYLVCLCAYFWDSPNHRANGWCKFLP